MRSVRYHVPDTAPGIFHIALVAGQDDHMHVIDTPARRPAIVVTYCKGIRFSAQKWQLQYHLDLVHRPVHQVFSGHHARIEFGEVGAFDNPFDPTQSVKIITLLLRIQIEYRLDMPLGNDQSMARIHRGSCYFDPKYSHLFHTLTEDAGVRLHMTRRLMELNTQTG